MRSLTYGELYALFNQLSPESFMNVDDYRPGDGPYSIRVWYKDGTVKTFTLKGEECVERSGS